MNFAETVSFIAQSLSLYYSDHNLECVKNWIDHEKVDWEAVVKVSTQHYVLPALYANLKKADLVSLLPEDLVAYMQYISKLNMERNDEIIKQCLDIKDLFQKHDLDPVFLKGTGLLLGKEELKHYRMLADIDILLPKDQNAQAYQLLQKNGYYTNKKITDIPTERHRPRLVHENYIASVEIHDEVLRTPNDRYLSGATVIDRRFRKSDINLPHLDDQLALAIASSQINDFGHDRRTISLKTMNDVLILKSRGAQLEMENHSLGKVLNNYISFVSEISKIKLEYHRNADTQLYLEEMRKILTDEKFREKQSKAAQKELYFKTRLGIIPKAIRNKEYRKWLWERLKVGNRVN
ncbi:hypothetical protein BST97_04310 [Nonlabens spongiae]|uniref:Nucleotidyltransferase n=1 Tax=Nonlabens spongiae TaxID=331648 RepID=A0A1W6MI41_9FLAO|nr:nucleotidyltransferase family protein [Nonlabens spongiae]ARN77265.1 hypothetical protein BST97_04310 [Nonlabens spongiae]